MCMAHGVNIAYVGQPIGGGAPLSSTRHDVYKAKADAGGGWVYYPWRNSPNEPWYSKAGYVVKVTRDGESYYVGSGLAMLDYEFGETTWRDYDFGYEESDCNINWKSSCAEKWAHRVAGQRIAQIHNATSHADMLGACARGAAACAHANRDEAPIWIPRLSSLIAWHR